MDNKLTYYYAYIFTLCSQYMETSNNIFIYSEQLYRQILDQCNKLCILQFLQPSLNVL